MSSIPKCALLLFFFFNDTATTEIYTLSLHDALPILTPLKRSDKLAICEAASIAQMIESVLERSEEHTSELQSLTNLVCRLLLEKKKHELSVRGIAVDSRNRGPVLPARGRGEQTDWQR